MKQTLLDILLQRGYQKKEALALILSGNVKVNDTIESKQGLLFDLATCSIKIKSQKNYVSRAAHKLIDAIDTWNISLENKICMDLGCSHGGFSQVLLEKDAKHIYAIDVAYGIYDYSLRYHSSITLLEKKNIRNIDRNWFSKKSLQSFYEEPIFVVCDISFMSLQTILKALKVFCVGTPSKSVDQKIKMQGLFLLKPQFENSKATQKGIIKDQKSIEDILNEFEQKTKKLDYKIKDFQKSALLGKHGNQEYVFYLSLD